MEAVNGWVWIVPVNGGLCGGVAEEGGGMTALWWVLGILAVVRTPCTAQTGCDSALMRAGCGQAGVGVLCVQKKEVIGALVGDKLAESSAVNRMGSARRGGSGLGVDLEASFSGTGGDFSVPPVVS